MGLAARHHGVSLRVVDGYRAISAAVQLCAPVDQFTGRIHGVNVFAPSPALRARLRQDHSPDVYHLHGAWVLPPLYGWEEAKRRGVPYLIEVMGHYEPWSLRQNSWIKVLMRAAYQDRILRDAACIHVNSIQEARNLRSLGFHGPFAVIPVGVDMVKAEVMQQSIYGAESHEPFDGRFFLYLARLDEKKGIRLLLQSWAEIRLRHPDVTLVICGTGAQSYVNALKAFIAENDMKEQCVFLGQVDEVTKAEAFARAAFYVLPSFSENFGNTVAESLAFGCPVLTTVHTPWRDLETHQCGWRTATDTENLTTALTTALQTPAEELRIMGMRGKELVQRRYSLESVIDSLEVTYQWMLGGTLPRHLITDPYDEESH